MTSSTPADSWHYDHAHGVYFHPPSSTYAIPDPITGQWSYVPAAEFRTGESSRPLVTYDEREEGQIDEDVGWGGLMEPEQVAAVQSRTARPNGGAKHPAYGGGSTWDDPTVYAYGAREPTPPKETPKHILRLVVLSSEVLPPGDIAIIDARESGVQIGRDRCVKGGVDRVRLKEMEVSKTHAAVYWGKGEADDDGEGWRVVDLGSTHGTFVVINDEKTRLSPAKHSSKPFRLSHLASLIIGGTTFSCHIHPEWPCDQCQLRRDNEIALDDGTIPQPVAVPEEAPRQPWAMDSKQKRENREVKRKREMAMLKETLLNRGQPIQKEPERQYIDRSAMRRRLHPPSPPPPRRSSSPSRGEPVSAAPTAPSAFASGLLASQGWKPGSGLGKDGAGRAEPINVELRNEKRGLGANGAKAVVDAGEGDWRQRGKYRRYEDYAKGG